MLISNVLEHKGAEVLQIRDSDDVRTAADVLSRHRIGALVVQTRSTATAGIFSERDLVNAIAREGATALARPVRDLMSSPIATCRPTDRIDAALTTMASKRVRHLPVMTEDGTLKGLVSIGDLVKRRLDEKELEANVLLEISRLRSRRV